MLQEKEPNDEPSDANGAIISNLTCFGVSTPPQVRRNDYLKFKPSSEGRVELSLTGIPAGHNCNLIFRDEDTMLRGHSANTGSADVHISTDIYPGSTYYIQAHNHGGFRTHEAHQLEVPHKWP